MATADLESPGHSHLANRADVATRAQQTSSVELVWSALASLKLTVVLLSLLIALVFFGTLAQVEHDVWYVVRQGYFRVWFAWVEFQTLAALVGVFRPNDLQLPGGFYFPGGYLIGAAMAVNLIAAHSQRYRVSAKGSRMIWGLLLLVAGVATTWLVVARALDSAHDASISPHFADTLWNILRAAFAGVALAGAYGLSLAWGRLRRPEWFALAGFDLVLLLAAAYLFAHPEWEINDAGMRIVWQLLQATVAGGLLMASCWLLFAKRSGVVLLHVGVALLMAHEFYVGETNVEANMMINEGETANYVFDTRAMELAVIDRSDDDVDHVTVIPAELLRQAASGAAGERVIRDDRLPVDIRVLDYYTNADVRPVASDDENPATLGAGQRLIAEPIDNVSGVGGALDLPAAYIELIDKQSGDSIGTLLTTAYFDPFLTSRLGPFQLSRLPGIPVATGGEQTVDLAGEPLAVALRFERIYKPYEVTLLDFSHDKFMGTSKAKNFSSDVKLVDNELGAELVYKIWMNNPLRYRGETFYQADWNKVTGTGTVLQVVKNESWMLPYIGCAVVAVGMIVHFLLTLARFLNRRMRDRQAIDDEDTAPWTEKMLRPTVLIPLLLTLTVAGFFLSKTRTKPLLIDGMSVSEFAQLPVLDEGRVKPIDTVARNMLQFLSSRQEAAVSKDGRTKIPASQWLLNTIVGKLEARDYCVLRITNLELIETLGLDRRPGFYRYSVNDLKASLNELTPQIDAAQAIGDPKRRTPFQRDVLELAEKLNLYSMMVDAFSLPRAIGGGATDDDMRRDQETYARLGRAETVSAVVPDRVDGEWQTLFEANVQALVDRIEQRTPNPAAVKLATVIFAYDAGDKTTYNKAMDDYHQLLANYQAMLEDPKNAEFASTLKTVEKLNLDRTRFEYLFNSATPFYYCSVIYLVAMLLSAAAWLGLPKVLGRSAVGLIVVTFLVHTLAIAARVYISDRPPITNLYTTAICIGWAIVLFMLVFEAIFKLGIGSFVASTVGFATLLIAHFLGLDEDTFTVMQAVLDTQFWLSTHVITINLGYATTMLAGCLGIVYLIAVHCFNLFGEKQARQLSAMIYGALCFAILFSFVGTVLGGLWADDSWGRFWGWDPKENGALMIVLWNAVTLHARWGKLVGPRGLAMLAVVGNIITAWSWFGVNQLSQGLHAYAFRDDLAFYLGCFFVSQVTLLVIGSIPWHEMTRPRSASPA